MTKSSYKFFFKKRPKRSEKPLKTGWNLWF